MDWDKLRIFHVVAESGSFTRAAETLHLSQSAISRQISNLEASLHVPLFHRHARGIILTEQGEVLYRAVRDIFARLQATELRIRETKEKALGPLKITTTIAFGSVWIAPHIKEFMELYPDIEISLILADTEMNIAMREADVAIRMFPPRQGELIRRHLLTIRNSVFASKSYLETYGEPKTLDDLDNHKLIVFGDSSRSPVPDINWLLEAGRTSDSARKATLAINNIYGIYQVVCAGGGIGCFPDYLVKKDDPLVKILKDAKAPEIESYFVYSEELRDSQRVIVFRDFLLRIMKAWNYKV